MSFCLKLQNLSTLSEDLLYSNSFNITWAIPAPKSTMLLFLSYKLKSSIKLLGSASALPPNQSQMEYSLKKKNI